MCVENKFTFFGGKQEKLFKKMKQKKIFLMKININKTKKNPSRKQKRNAASARGLFDFSGKLETEKNDETKIFRILCGTNCGLNIQTNKQKTINL